MATLSLAPFKQSEVVPSDVKMGRPAYRIMEGERRIVDVLETANT